MQVTVLRGIIYTISFPSSYNLSAIRHLPLTQAQAMQALCKLPLVPLLPWVPAFIKSAELLPACWFKHCH